MFIPAILFWTQHYVPIFLSKTFAEVAVLAKQILVVLEDISAVEYDSTTYEAPLYSITPTLPNIKKPEESPETIAAEIEATNDKILLMKELIARYK